jgi:hypothetical protein
VRGESARSQASRPLVDRRQVEAVLAARAQWHERDAGHRREGEVVRVERLDDQRLVTRCRAGHQREQDGLAAAGGGDDLVGSDLEPEAVVVAGECREVLRRARRG